MQKTLRRKEVPSWLCQQCVSYTYKEKKYLQSTNFHWLSTTPGNIVIGDFNFLFKTISLNTFETGNVANCCGFGLFTIIVIFFILSFIFPFPLRQSEDKQTNSHSSCFCGCFYISLTLAISTLLWHVFVFYICVESPLNDNYVKKRSMKLSEDARFSYIYFIS